MSRFALVATCVFLLGVLHAPAADASTGIALYGTPKYPENFQHFDYVNPDAPKGGAIKLATSAPFDSVNPFILKGVAAPGLIGNVYQTLMTGSYDEPESYYALIADSVTLSADRKTADFTLNPAARWQDGTPITADDVVWSLTTLKAKGHPSYRVLFKPITVEKLGERSVRFHFADTTERELPLIAAAMPVLPKAYFCADEKPTDKTEAASTADAAKEADKKPAATPASTTTTDTAQKSCIAFDKTTLTLPMGSGPYRVKSIDPGRGITLERVKNYWGANLPSQKGLNNFDSIQYDVYRDDVVSVEGIKSHQFDFYEEFIARNWATSYDIPAIKSGQLVKTRIPHKIPRGMQGFLFNTREAKFSDVRVREAIGLTLDFEWMDKVLFYDAYERNSSYFNNTDFAATGLPSADEKTLLEPYHSDVPTTTFTTPYTVPKTDGSGFARDNLIKAQTLLDDAGWVMKNGVRVNAKTGEPLTIEFLMTQRTFERVIGIMRHNLDKLGIASTFRYVDASQYQKRVDHRSFDIISIWWNQGLFYPGQEQYMFWHSSQADIEGIQNLGGVKNKAVDSLVERIQRAKDLAELKPAGQALDRVLLNEHYVIPHWNINAWRVLYWDQFGRPDITPAYNIGIDSWWAKNSSAANPSQNTTPKNVAPAPEKKAPAPEAAAPAPAASGATSEPIPPARATPEIAAPAPEAATPASTAATPAAAEPAAPESSPASAPAPTSANPDDKPTPVAAKKAAPRARKAPAKSKQKPKPKTKHTVKKTTAKKEPEIDHNIPGNNHD